MTEATRLTVVRREGAFCWATCACGRPGEIKLRWQSVRRGEVKSCGCLRIEKLKERSTKPIEVGAHFGRLTVLAYEGKRCRCRCGCPDATEIWVSSTHLRTHHTQSCGCLQRERARDAAIHPIAPGTRFGKLVVLRQIGSQCVCRCDCDATKEIVVETNKLRFEHTQSCGCRRSEVCREMAENKLLPPGETAFNSLYAQYRGQAFSRNLTFDLDAETFRALTKQPCAYCGAPPGQIKISPGALGSYLYSGVDRINNAFGYTSGNVQPCCGVCNCAKADRSEPDFLTWVRLLVQPPEADLSVVLQEAQAYVKLFRRYRNTALSKRLEFALELDDFSRLVQSRCHYCRRPPHRPVARNSQIFYTGLDRLRSDLGYLAANVVPCCWDCNNAKSIGTPEDFLAWARRVADHRRRSRS